MKNVMAWLRWLTYPMGFWTWGLMFIVAVVQSWLNYRHQILANEQNDIIARYQKIIHDLPDGCVVAPDRASVIPLLKQVYRALP